MANHSSASAREETPHAINSTPSNTLNTNDSSAEMIEALTGMICGAGEEPAAALLLLMAAFENSTDPKALANTTKHLAFTRCGEWNVYGMVDAQIALLEGELLTGNTLAA